MRESLNCMFFSAFKFVNVKAATAWTFVSQLDFYASNIYHFSAHDLRSRTFQKGPFGSVSVQGGGLNSYVYFLV